MPNQPTSADKEQQLRILHTRLTSLHSQVTATHPENADKPGAPGSGLGPLVRGFNGMLARARELTNDDAIISEVLTDIEPVREVDTHISAAYHINAKHELIFAIDALLAAIGPRLLAATGAPSNVSIEREGLFVAGQHFDALLAATRILETAQARIILVDGYIGPKVLELMKAKADNTAVDIITKATTLPGSVLPLAMAFNDQYGRTARLSIRTSNAFHDRFLLIDDIEFYHFGASIKNLGERGFMFSKIEEPAVVALLRKTIAAEWETATVVV
jgi:hypothetical protein